MNIYNIIHLQEVESTMDGIKNYGVNTILYSDTQTKGRGKQTRVWDSNANNNLYMSIMIDSSNKKLNYSNLSFLVAVAMLKSIKSFETNVNIQTKWPNDILINNKKIIGILLENDLLLNHLIIGIGVNIDYFPENTMFNATSLKNEAINITKEELLKIFIKQFDLYLEDWKINGFENIQQEWLNYAFNYKKEIIVKNNRAENLSGIFEDFDKEGTLILRMHNNEIKKIYSGDIF